MIVFTNLLVFINLLMPIIIVNLFSLVCIRGIISPLCFFNSSIIYGALMFIVVCDGSDDQSHIFCVAAVLALLSSLKFPVISIILGIAYILYKIRKTNFYKEK